MEQRLLTCSNAEETHNVDIVDRGIATGLPARPALKGPEHVPAPLTVDLVTCAASGRSEEELGDTSFLPSKQLCVRNLQFMHSLTRSLCCGAACPPGMYAEIEQAYLLPSTGRTGSQSSQAAGSPQLSSVLLR